MKLSREELKGLMKNKLMNAGLNEAHAEIAAEILTWSDERGYHSHGAVRVEYYSERIAKGGITANPHFNARRQDRVLECLTGTMDAVMRLPRKRWTRPSRWRRKTESQ